VSRTCPTCRASLDDDLADRTGTAECPFCGADVSALYGDDGAAWDADESEDLDEGELRPVVRRRVGNLAPPPGLIQVVERSDDRLVVAIPPGGRTGGLGCFAFFWLGFMVVFTGAVAWSGVEGMDAKDFGLLGIVAFLGLFWLVGFGLAYVWARLRFLSTYLLLERDRLVVQRILFRWKGTRETQLGPESRATMETSYEENDVPVLNVTVTGLDRKEQFGVRLGDAEKRWFVRTINEFLHGPEAVAVDEWGRPLDEFDREELPTENVESLAPHELPADSPIRIDESFVDGLRFSLPFLTGGLANGCAVGFGCAGILWIGVTLSIAAVLVGQGEAFFAILPAFVALGGLPVLAIGLAAKRARVTVQVDADRVRMRWHLGPIGGTQSVDHAAITGIGLGTTSKSSTNGRVTARGKGCILRAGGKSYPLTTTHGEEVGRQVGGILRYELERRGVVLQDLP
jgi:hypothetical protein